VSRFLLERDVNNVALIIPLAADARRTDRGIDFLSTADFTLAFAISKLSEIDADDTHARSCGASISHGIACTHSSVCIKCTN